jgi:hypothetical protein
MTYHVRGLFSAALLLGLLCSATGCVYTVAGTKLPPITPSSPSFQPIVEYTVGDFAFTLEGGKMITSNYAGRLLNNGIMASWKDRGYIGGGKYVESQAFSRTADYNVTLSGSQYGESSIGMQILSGLTLFLIPHSVTHQYDVQYAVEDVKTGKKYRAAVQECDKTYLELFLLFALPIANNGHKDTLQRMGDHLYEQLRRQGAFERVSEPTTSPP